MPDTLYADVVLPIPVEHPFTYAVPPSLTDRAEIGMRAIVPFNRRTMTGYVVALKATSDRDDVLPLTDLPDEEPVFRPDMVELCRWISDYYCCSLGEALQTAVPAGLSVRTKLRYTLQPDQLGAGRYTDRQRAIVAELHRRGPLTEGQLAAAIGRGSLSNSLQSLARRGVLLAEPVVTDSGVSMKTETYVKLRMDTLLDTKGLVALQRRAPKQAAVYLDLIHGASEHPAGVLYEKHGVNAATINALAKRQLVEREEREIFRIPDIASDGHAAVKFTLNAEQLAAYKAVTDAMARREYQTFLLQGITGSGKTEVYLQAIEHALDLGRDAIILVPEISLTPQTVGRFKARFKEDIAVLHSGLGAGERFDEWRRAKNGDVRIVVGARSAVFAPLKDVGIVVVDEEHDTSYKQGETPRYHGRDVAIVRAKLNNAVCVLGSATPSIESYHNSVTGKSQRLELSQRATQAKLPAVQIVDMREESKEAGGQALLSRVLEQEVSACVKRGEQAVLLLNRRGFAPYVLCPQCGWIAECNDCQVSLTYHAKGGHLACHYCNARRPVPQACEECGFKSLVYLGTGTQKIEDFLVRTFEWARVERMDADTTAGKGGHAKILGRFGAGKIDILIGTQMIAKGHDYPGVTVVGVINADTGLSVPDFRAAENTFQLLTQVAGRAGRAQRSGKVIIQTFRPKHYAIQAAAQHDFAAFYNHEIKQRCQTGYPPYRRMANFSIDSEDPVAAERSMMILHRIVVQQIQEHGFDGVEILGPAPAAVRKVKKRYRWNLAVLSRSAKRLNLVARSTRDLFGERVNVSKAQLRIDLDPYGMF